MSGGWAIFKREVQSAWLSPLAWILLTTFLILQGGVFYSIVVHMSQVEGGMGGSGPIQAYFGQQSLLMGLSLLLLCPALTMRSVAEERRTGSIEALLSAPVTSAAIVVGKYAGSLLTYCLMWLPTVLYSATLRGTGTLHTATILSGYLGVFLVGAGYLAVGILMSTLAKSQFVALLLTSTFIFSLFLLGIGEYIFDSAALRAACGYVSLTSTLEETAQGIIDSRRLIFYGSLTLWALFVSSRVMDSWRTPA